MLHTLRFAAAFAVVGFGVLGLPGTPGEPAPAPVHDTEIELAAPGTAKSGGWSSVVDVPDGTESVVLAWDGEPEGAVAVRSHDGGGWTDWVEIHADPTHAPDDAVAARSVAGPVWVGDADSVEVAVEHGDLEGLTLHALRIDDPPPPPPGAVQPAGAAVAQPGILPRSAWGAAPWTAGQNGCRDEPSTARVRFGVLHHTVTTNNYSPEQADDQIRSVQHTHQRIQGYCDIAYNFVVDRFGRIWEGRAGGVDRGVIGGHSKGFNTGSFGVVLLGQHHPSAGGAAPVSSAARGAVVQLFRWKFALHGIDARARVAVTSQCDTSTGPCRYPAGQQVVLNTIVGHRDVQLTACPGDLAQPIVSAIRADVADAVLRSGPFFPLPGWQPEDDKPEVLTLDRWGGVHPAGSAEAVPHSGVWPGQGFARAIGGTAEGGWVLDLHGGLHPYGRAGRVATPVYLPGWDIGRSVVGDPVAGSGYLLDAFGGVHPFGGAPRVDAAGYWFGRDLARDLTAMPGGRGGWKVDAYGGLHPWGDAPPVTGTGYWLGWDIARAIAADPSGGARGWVLDGFGGLHPFGGAPRLTLQAGYRTRDVFRDLVMISPTAGYAIDTDGVPWPVGDAPPIIPSLTMFGTGLGLGLAANPAGG